MTDKNERLREARVARLATVSDDGYPLVLPVCFVLDSHRIYTAIDKKPKGVPPAKLARVGNVRREPRVALLVDEYREDWSRLWYVLVRGSAVLVSDEDERQRAVRLLRRKYPQYRGGLLPDDAPVIRIGIERLTSWSGEPRVEGDRA